MATGLWGIAMMFTLPDSISSCKFLTEEEKQYATERVAVAGTGNVKAPKASEWKIEQAIECLLDVKTWFFVAISICTQASYRMVILFERKLTCMRQPDPEQRDEQLCEPCDHRIWVHRLAEHVGRHPFQFYIILFHSDHVRPHFVHL